MAKNQSSTSQKRRQKRRRNRPPDTSFACTLLLLASTLSTATAKEDESPSIIATYGPHLYHSRSNYLQPSNLDYTKFTRINYTSFRLNNLGRIWEGNSNIDPIVLYGPYDWNPDATKEHVKYCHKNTPELGVGQCAHHKYEGGLIGLSHMNGVQVFASIGGSFKREEEILEEKEVFRIVASTIGGRLEFATQCEWLINHYKFDGIDIQWRYPETEEEMNNYNLLLQTVRERLDKLGLEHGGATYGLTATMPCNSSNEDGKNYDDVIANQVSSLDQILTEINLDTMNFHGTKAKTAGFNAPLYTNTDEIDYASVNGCVLQYLKNGASREQINIGLPFYGHSYKDALEIGDACNPNWLGECSDTITWRRDQGTPKYYNIYGLLPTMPTYFDKETLTPVALNEKGAVSYDDPKSICYKTEYAMMNQLNGVVIHELGMDILLDKSTPLLDAVNFKMLNPNMDCGGIEFEKLFQWREVSSTSGAQTTAGINEQNAAIEAESNAIDEELDESKTTYRYTCGFGEGDAKERCSDPGWDDISCETGTCPEEGMLCFVVECVKPKGYALSGKKEPYSYAPIWVKSEPKPIVHRKPERKVKGETLASKVEAASKESGGGLITPTKQKVRACGSDYFDAAGNCGTRCPNGHSDCSNGFCFLVECGATPPTTTTTTTPYAGQMVNKYQCGFDRTEALTCQEECDVWSCDGGKDCFLVPCPP